jgi:hypothetical protein
MSYMPERDHTALEIIEELEEKAKNLVAIVDFSNTQRYLVMVRQEALTCNCSIKLTRETI